MEFWLIVLRAALAFIIVNVGMVLVAFLVYFERKVAAHMQARQGPNRAGPLGLLQSFADLLKMLVKENTVPSKADKLVFFLGPVVATFAALGALSVIPWGPGRNQPGHIDLFGQQIGWPIAEVNVGILLILAMSSLGVYGLIMGGWASNSKYSLLGGLRSSSQVISYEITLGISLVGVFIMSGTLDLIGITSAQHPLFHNPTQPGIWFILLQPVAFFIFLTSAIAETNRTPFDLPEAESELVGGYHTEYSGIRFGLYFLGEYIGMLTVSAITAVCFLGGFSSPFAAWFDQPAIGVAPAIDLPFISGLLGSGLHWLVLKIAVFIFVYYWLRWTLPRFRYDQLMGLCWKVFLPATLANILIISVLKLLIFPPGITVEEYAARWWGWWIIAAIQVVLGILALLGVSRMAGVSWFGKAERPVLVDRQVILVRNVHGGRGTIEGEARAIEVTRNA